MMLTFLGSVGSASLRPSTGAAGTRPIVVKIVNKLTGPGNIRDNARDLSEEMIETKRS